MWVYSITKECEKRLLNVNRNTIVAPCGAENPLFSRVRSSQRDNSKTIKEISRTLESPVFSGVFFMLGFSEIVVKSAEF